MAISMTADQPINSEIDTRLAIDGGQPVRTTPLPWELPGAYWIGEEERELVNRVISARSPFRYYGLDPQKMVDTFENEWCQVYGHRHALGVSSGTAALTIAMSALNIGPGDEVLVPGYLWVSCVSAVVRTGAIPKLIDIDDTFCIDPEDLKRKIGPQSRAVLCVHMSGAPGNIAEIAAICREHKLFLVEDCAQAAGASQNGRAVGRFGDIGIFSFQLNKNMTSGDGGLIVCENDALFRRIVALHDLGYPRNEAGRLDTTVEDCQLWGIGARMSELTGAMVLAQMRKLPKITHAMRSAKWKIRNALKDIPGLGWRHIPDPAGDTGPALLMTLPDEATARRFIDALKAEGIAGPEGSLACITMREWGMHWYSNIPSLVHRRSNSRDGYPWTHPQNAFAAGYDYRHGALAKCDEFHARGALLAIASTLTDQDVDDIITAARKVANSILR
ncbi:DegT/DnrJ/EryC1/StrS family aminotransferase [Paralcaligenes sp. KSB-10]|uniref:DegT/DnrJ/EryC1/StrS family aminotransferase n=1 Tax=Paralcaligenes sp. KSB-10 TaxID=2901142 RepID=UPI001E2B0398|nr:DegT/DnrJ/EryC1/StrS family aminotransferase [Paralcaligenes sp. KSB-10]UHL65489.1 DegT/DnrJ/EryC1/StrS family aminotransferase [Paralcaligenes sp. KSB-10]